MTDAGSSRQNVTMNSAAEALHKFNHSFLSLLLVTVINSKLSLKIKKKGSAPVKSLLSVSKKQVNVSCSKCPGICLFTILCVCIATRMCISSCVCVVAPLCSVNLGRCCLSEPCYGLMLSLVTEAV